MKKLFGIVAAVAMIMTAAIFTSCSQPDSDPYAGKLYNTYAVIGVDSSVDTDAVYWDKEISEWESDAKYETKTNLSYSELLSYLCKIGLSESDASDIISNVTSQGKGGWNLLERDKDNNVISKTPIYIKLVN